MDAATPSGEDRHPLLLVEDNPLAVEIARSALEECTQPRYEITHAATLADALRALRTQSFEVVLLDLGLPDSSGLATLEAVRPAAPPVPIVVLTAVEDEETALAALAQGADDYLYKGELDRRALRRSLRYSTERRRMLLRHVGARRREALRRELRALDRVDDLGRPPSQADHLPQPPAVDEAVWHDLVDRYAQIVERTAATAGGLAATNTELWTFANELGGRDLAPDQAGELHTEALRRLVAGRGSDQAEPLLEAGRALFVRLLADLVSYWRSRAVTARR